MFKKTERKKHLREKIIKLGAENEGLKNHNRNLDRHITLGIMAVDTIRNIIDLGFETEEAKKELRKHQAENLGELRKRSSENLKEIKERFSEIKKDLDESSSQLKESLGELKRLAVVFR